MSEEDQRQAFSRTQGTCLQKPGSALGLITAAGQDEVDDWDGRLCSCGMASAALRDPG